VSRWAAQRPPLPPNLSHALFRTKPKRMDTKDANAHPLDRIDEAIIDLQKVAPGVSLLVLVALSNQSGRAAQKAFEATLRNCPEVHECQLISGHFDYSLRLRCRDMEHYRLLSESWMNDDTLHIDKLVAHPVLAEVKPMAR